LFIFVVIYFTVNINNLEERFKQMMTINIQKTLLPAIAVIFLTACGGGNSSSSTKVEEQSITKIKGQILDAPIANLIYTCGGETLRTNKNGEFLCSTLPVTFSLGHIELGTVANLPSDSKIYLQDLLNLDRSNFNDKALIRMAVLVQSMDSNRTSTIDIPDDVHAGFTTEVTLSDLTSMSEIDALITQVGKTPITQAQAITHLKEFSSVDTQVPVVTLTGVTADISVGGSYHELGATVSDNVDSHLTAVSTGDVDTTKVGTYTVTYTATDSAGNIGTAKRVVNVIDHDSPVVTLTGVTADIPVGGTYHELGATVSDNVDSHLTAVITGDVDTTKVGSYTVTYTATDRAGNIGTAKRVVKVIDRGAPVVTLIGVTADIEVGENYSELGATVTDNVDTNLTAVITGDVDTTKVGSYTLTYTATDSVGNIGKTTRVVKVVDTTKPVITLEGNETVTVTEGTTYTDAGARANDNYDGDISSDINTTNPVDTTTIGNYTVTYNVEDDANNTATPVTRIVNVVADTIAPTITLLGNAIVFLDKNATYIDAGATANDNKDGNISANIITTGMVDTTRVGSYVITYNVKDDANNTATPVKRRVNVTPTITAPFKTGQLTSYDAAGNEVNDSSVKDDGYYQKGVSKNFTRDDATEIVTDNVTGLMWQDNNDVTAFLRTYGDSPYYCSIQTLGGYEDWRMPTISELESIIDYKGSYRNIDGQAYLPLIDAAFTNKVEERYWSSTPYVGSEDVWIVYSYTGVVDKSLTDDSVQNYTRCVRNAR